MANQRAPRQDEIRILSDEVMRDHNPSAQEVEDYAKYIGIDTEFDRDLLPIAVRGLCAVPPQPWKACQSRGDTEVFFFNFETGESVWDHPCDKLAMDEVTEAYEKRQHVVVNLIPEIEENGDLTITGVNLAGKTVCEATSKAAELDHVSFIEDKLRAALVLPEGTVPRFVLPNSSLLGYSLRSHKVSEVFAVSL